MDFHFIQLFLILLFGGYVSILPMPLAKKRKFFLIFAFLYLYVLEGFRSLEFGGDPWYQDLYRATSWIPWNSILYWDKYLSFKSETGYVVLNKCLNLISNNVQFLYCAFRHLVTCLSQEPQFRMVCLCVSLLSLL